MNVSANMCTLRLIDNNYNNIFSFLNTDLAFLKEC